MGLWEVVGEKTGRGCREWWERKQGRTLTLSSRDAPEALAVEGKALTVLRASRPAQPKLRAFPPEAGSH